MNRPKATVWEEVLTFPPDYDRDFVERLLGRRRRKGLSPSTARRLQRLEGQLHSLLAPCLVQNRFRPGFSSGPGGDDDGFVTLGRGVTLGTPKLTRVLRGAVEVVCYVATVGPEIDGRVVQLQREGALADAAILDALGSGAVEMVAESFHRQVAAQLQPHGLLPGPRFSPGYCDWPISDQGKLFSLLNHELIGVKLEPTGLMRPRKTVSSLFGVFPQADAPADRDLIPCRRCDKRDCIARR